MLAAKPHTAPEELISRLDSAVSEVFETMLERSCAPVASQHVAGEHITAQIEFSGAIEGLCVVYATPQVAQLTAEALLGPVSGPHDPMVDDAIGELCNMIVGGRKSKLDTSAAVCLISVPTITRADSSRFTDALHTTTTFNRSYSFQGHVFGIVLGL